MGDSGPTYQVGTLLSGADVLHAGGILQVVYTRDCPVTWSVSLYSIRPGSHVYDSFLGEFPTCHGNTIDDEHCFSSLDERSVREDHLDFRRHATSMHPGF